MAFALAVLALGGATSARAEAPEGAYTIPFSDGAGLAVPSGGSEACATARGIETCLALPLETGVFGTMVSPEDPNTLQLSIASPDVSSNLVVTRAVGLLSGTHRRPTAIVELGAQGTITEGTITSSARASSLLRCKLDPELADTLLCRGKLGLCVFNVGGDLLGCTTLPLATRLALVERTFDLELELATDADGVVTGSAFVRFGEDEGFPRGVTGKYDPRSDTASLKLEAFDNALGSKLVLKRVRFVAGGASGGRIVYRLAGQKGSVELPE